MGQSFETWYADFERRLRLFGIIGEIPKLIKADCLIDFANGCSAEDSARAQLQYSSEAHFDFPKPSDIKHKAKIAYSYSTGRIELEGGTFMKCLDLAAQDSGFKNWKDYKFLRKQFNNK